MQRVLRSPSLTFCAKGAQCMYKTRRAYTRKRQIVRRNGKQIKRSDTHLYINIIMRYTAIIYGG